MPPGWEARLRILTLDTTGDEVQDFLGKGDDDTTGQSQENVGALGRIVGLQRQTNLDNAPTQQNQAYRTDQTEDKGGQVIDYG